ncbi:NADP-dependent oxidoreductase domain-containing protein, partial [Hyaloraphidium curvatum]
METHRAARVPPLEQPIFSLSNGVKVPGMGFGTYFGDEDAPLSQERVDELVKAAVDAGFRHVDCAFLYANEAKVGRALNKVLGSHRREELFVTSKLYGTCHEPEVVPMAFAKSCGDLGLDFLDLYLIHCPLPFPLPPAGLETIDPVIDHETGLPVVGTTPLMDTWRAMELLYDSGACRAVGVSNWTVPMIQKMLDECSVPPMVNQVEVHPLLPQSGPDPGWNGREKWPTTGLVDFCKSNGIHVTAYSPLGAGHFGAEDPSVLQHPVVLEVADRCGISPASACLSWVAKRGMSCVSRTKNLARVRENIRLYDLGEEEMRMMSSIPDRWRYIQTLNGWGIDTAGDTLGLKKKKLK